MSVIYLSIYAAFILVMISVIISIISNKERESFQNALTYLSTVIYINNKELIPKNGIKWIDSWSAKHNNYLHRIKLSKERKLKIVVQWKDHMNLLDNLPAKNFQTISPSISFVPAPDYSGVPLNYTQPKQEENPPKPKKSAPEKEEPKSLHPVTPKQLDVE